MCRRFIGSAALLPIVAIALASVEAAVVRPLVLFATVLVVATLCMVTAVALGVVAHRNDQAELGFVAAFFFTASALPLVHGITTPTVLYAENAATMTSVFLVVPVGLVGVVPSVLRRTAFGRRIGRRWRSWALLHGAVTSALAVLLLVVPDLRFHPDPGSTAAWLSVAAMFTATVLIGQRHAWLADVAGRSGPTAIGAGFVLVGASTFAFIDTTPYSLWFWVAHGFDALGVFVATVGGVMVYHRHGRVDEIFKSVLTIDPHAAIELSLSPVVHRFVDDLNSKDQITRDHVVRTADLAVDVAENLRLGAEQVRRTGMAALLHDIGKLEIPDDILTKPGRLTDEEFAVMQTHAAAGGAMLADAPGLANLAGAVRSHHERFDGSGYPDRLAGPQIPIEARIVSACDAYDAMAHTRHYRTGLDPANVRAILQEHRGSQWDPVVIDALLQVIDHRSPSATFRLDAVGRTDRETANREFGCSCLPEDVLTGSR